MYWGYVLLLRVKRKVLHIRLRSLYWGLVVQGCWVKMGWNKRGIFSVAGLALEVEARLLYAAHIISQHNGEHTNAARLGSLLILRSILPSSSFPATLLF